MSADGPNTSVSEWLRGLEDDDSQAAQKLWDRYYARLTAVAEQRAGELAKAAVDAEDVAASVMMSLWRGARAGRLTDVKSRDELWWLLLALTHRKIVDHHRRQSAQKRGGDLVRTPLDHEGIYGYRFDELVAADLPPEYATVMEEEFERLLGLLRDDQLRQISVYRIEGYTNDEICELLGISLATVTRKLRLIRSTWAREVQH